jgi:hypothetical protein
MSDPAGIPALQDAIRDLHGCESKHLRTVRVREKGPTGKTVWRGEVEVFSLVRHPKAMKAYAWSERGNHRGEAALLRRAPHSARGLACQGTPGLDPRGRDGAGEGEAGAQLIAPAA